MVAAIEPNIASLKSGIIPRIVVREAIITGRNLLSALDMRAFAGSTPAAICAPISSMRTMQFFIIMPTRPNAPTIAQKVNVLPVSNIAPTIPIARSGMPQIIISGFL